MLPGRGNGSCAAVASGWWWCKL